MIKVMNFVLLADIVMVNGNSWDQGVLHDMYITQYIYADLRLIYIIFMLSITGWQDENSEIWKSKEIDDPLFEYQRRGN